MKPRHTLPLAALVLTLAACSQPAPPPASPPDASASADDPETFLGRKVKLAIDKARAELATRNLSLNNEFSFGDGSVRTVAGKAGKAKDDARPLGEITPQGDLLINGAKVDVTAEQHAMLIAYRGQVLAIAEAGMAMGIAGADMGGKALGGVAGAIFGGEQAAKDFEARMEAEGKRLEAEGLKLCERLRPLRDQQQALAASLPAFAPYATLTAEEVEDCGKGKDGPGAPNPAARDRIRDEIRDEIRKEVRAEIQREMQASPAPATK